VSELYQNDGRPSQVDWHEVYLENLPRVYNYFRYRVGDDFIAEDLAASTFEKAWRNRWRYNSDVAAFSSWLFAIAANVAVDYFRKEGKERAILPQVVSGHVESAEETAELRDELSRLTSLLSALPDRDADLFAMKHGADLTNRQISGLTGLSESNVGTILHRVAKRIRAKWDDET
jgi:RNA polymerase sigma-70 factor (ECF subfamily)